MKWTVGPILWVQRLCCAPESAEDSLHSVLKTDECSDHTKQAKYCILATYMQGFSCSTAKTHYTSPRQPSPCWSNTAANRASTKYRQTHKIGRVYIENLSHDATWRQQCPRADLCHTMLCFISQNFVLTYRPFSDPSLFLFCSAFRPFLFVCVCNFASVNSHLSLPSSLSFPISFCRFISICLWCFKLFVSVP